MLNFEQWYDLPPQAQAVVELRVVVALGKLAPRRNRLE